MRRLVDARFVIRNSCDLMQYSFFLSLHLVEETKAFLAVQPQIPVGVEYSAETAEQQAAILYLAAVVTLAQRLAAVFLAGVAALLLAGDCLVGELLLVVIPVREFLAVSF